MLQSVAAATTAATVLGTAHSHQAAGHRQLGSLSKVRQDTSRRVGQTSLQRSLRLLSLETSTQKPNVITKHSGNFITDINLKDSSQLESCLNNKNLKVK